MNYFSLLIAMLSTGLPAAAYAAIGEGRSLPSGEEHAQVVMQIFSSPQGEVQFTEIEGNEKSYSALLRLPSGALAALREVHGEHNCRIWLNSLKETSLPMGCEFMFSVDSSGSFFHVQSEDMKEASLFQAVKGLLKGPYVAL